VRYQELEGTLAASVSEHEAKNKALSDLRGKNSVLREELAGATACLQRESATRSQLEGELAADSEEFKEAKTLLKGLQSMKLVRQRSLKAVPLLTEGGPNVPSRRS
jgi:chromosome segregation ATPase